MWDVDFSRIYEKILWTFVHRGQKYFPNCHVWSYRGNNFDAII